jgi:hypothetical protein
LVRSASEKTALLTLQAWGYNSQVYEAWLKENYSEDGWEVSNYLGSQGSISSGKSGGKTLKFWVYKYVEV